MDAIANLKSGKAKGLDLLSNDMLKNSQYYVLFCIRKLFNRCFTCDIHHQSCSNGYTSRFFKCDDSNKLVNNGAITITSTVGKLFNSILNFRLYKFTKKHNLIHLSQIGFTEDARTSYHLFVLKCLVDKYCNTKRELYVSRLLLTFIKPLTVLYLQD